MRNTRIPGKGGDVGEMTRFVGGGTVWLGEVLSVPDKDL